MKINEMIKKRRLDLGLTQEQVGAYLGVSTPAVNKWEKAKAYPDITLLPPLARLLKTDLNALLSFRENLTDQEIGHLMNDLSERIKVEGFQEGFQMAMDKICEFPTCDLLILNVATLLKGSLLMSDLKDTNDYETKIKALIDQVTNSHNLEIRNQAISMTINQAFEEGDLAQAQASIDKLPNITYDKTEKQGSLYIKAGQLDQAKVVFGNKIISSSMDMIRTLSYRIDIAVKENRIEDGLYYLKVLEKVNKLFDLWPYNSHSANFEFYCKIKDPEKSIEALKKMLDALLEKWQPSKSPLYKHIKDGQDSFNQEMYTNIMNHIIHDPDHELDFIKDHPDFIVLLKNDKSNIEFISSN
jgi:transcriptional regulator with XRE-family HTH domain